ncbi:MAG TPA: 50S ribosomal protein L30 [Candidatus Lokiarchaeia archaeon]|nr:50S ribosomal protein L30 [Candidatus Lokiarchaeia archaeon]
MAKKASQEASAEMMAIEPAEKVHAKELHDVLLVAIRIRGDAKKPHWMKKTMELLRLHRKYHAVLLRATPDVNGMLNKVKDFIAYGIVSKELLVQLMQTKARLTGRKAFDQKSMSSLTGCATFEDLADALMNFSIKWTEIKHVVPVFRLHPARGGFFKGIKVQWGQGGVLGFHSDGIDKLLMRMI